MVKVKDCFLNKKTKQAFRIIAKTDSFIFQSELFIAETNYSQQFVPMQINADPTLDGYEKISYEEFKALFTNASGIIS